ncbi:3-phosphoshikimate 1-carboxyvinyltransferase [Prosthecochloris sp. SCSIO W1103]|uniref:3-phosphoshikimate 1-carboxyvinyltransferase n=1 Tax=Prosthecochloris sp. SCSIO W1103 TaxID=2992244 RepID=UPI00223CB295|nr:3-phosphoshikimate 1-carboxyvinyltransferase [Prosthecochloris sp. SCSIO W1103]UZJ38002.1 3-phosphoshikimate 1-carboxyvinyltransferase [Prosthecochloris sp. SCSIO W1103]
MKIYKGEVSTLPPDKSISHRAALIGAIAKGTTEISNFSAGFDNQSTLGVLQACGITVRQEKITKDNGTVVRNVVIHSNGLWSLTRPQSELMCGNSGSTMRMFAGILAAQPFESVLVGDSSLMKRPMHRVAEPLRLMGAEVTLSPKNTAPVVIKGSAELRPLRYELQVPSAQVKSLVAFAALHADGESCIVENLCSRNHTEVMLGLQVKKLSEDKKEIIVPGRTSVAAKPFHIPGDPSAACFIIALGLLSPGSEILLRDVCLNPTRTGYLTVLDEAGAEIQLENIRLAGGEKIGDILVRYSPSINPLRISDPALVANVIDEIPMLAVLSACATGEFELHNAAELRGKESDRISAVVNNMERLGFVCDEYADGFAITGQSNTVNGVVPIESYDDHRIAMSFAIADKVLPAELEISDSEVIGVSFPKFFEIIESLEH